MLSRIVALFLFACGLQAARPLTDEYVLLLNDPPLAKDGGALSLRHLDLAAKHTTLTRELSRRSIPVVGSSTLLLNAVFVRVPAGSRPDFLGLPGVHRTVRLSPMKRHLNAAETLIGVNPGAWSNPKIGGVGNAGAGVRIGIIDTGIDTTNPAFIDPGLPLPAGYPKGDAAYTNSKVIVARSYVNLLSSTDPQYSTPDDPSPLDHVGHGTAVAMIAGGETVQGPAATITGVAPKAYLGNYKVFGSPGLNDYTSAAAVIQALEDAYNDGMDTVTLALGDTAITAPLDSDCTATAEPAAIPVTSCDPRAWAVENAVGLGMTVVVSAGDSGPTLGTITTPGTAPSAITVGATTNAHDFVSHLHVTGAGEAFDVSSLFGSGPKPAAPFSAPLIDVVSTGDSGTACNPLPANSLSGSIALVVRGDCDFATKANNVQSAGASALLVYLNDPDDTIFTPIGLANTAIPTVLISNADGFQLRNGVSSGSVTVSLDPALVEISTTPNQIAPFSSRGPSIGLFSPMPSLSIKPEVVAPGAGIYTATQRFDPNGDFWDASGFNVGEGTSFAVGLVAGTVALVKQVNPGFSAAQLKSAVVNTTTATVTDGSYLADVNAVGAGLLQASGALSATMTCVPSTLSFGLLNGSYPAPFPSSQSFTLTNITGTAINVSTTVVPYFPQAPASVTLSTSPAFTLQAGASTTVTLSLTGSMPGPGSYQGEIDITGVGPMLRVPYLYQVTDYIPDIVFPVAGDGVVNPVGSANVIGFRVLDQFGAPISNASGVTWQVDAGTGTITSADTSTDTYGIAGANITFGPNPEAELWEGDLGGIGWQFGTAALNSPVISAVVNAGSSTVGSVAPGSYITLYGTDLASTSSSPRTGYLPLSLANTAVTFDVPSAGIQVPGALSYAGPGQVNVQVPWELSGQPSAIIKVINNGLVSFTDTIALSTYSPAFFDYLDAGTNQLQAVGTDLSYHVINSANPIPRGQYLILYANGLGPVSTTQTTGYPDSGNPVANTTSAVTVTIGGQNAPVLFSGLAPGFVGLYQVNVNVPAGIGTGLQPLTLTISGVTSPTSGIYVQ